MVEKETLDGSVDSLHHLGVTEFYTVARTKT